MNAHARLVSARPICSRSDMAAHHTRAAPSGTVGGGSGPDSRKQTDPL